MVPAANKGQGIMVMPAIEIHHAAWMSWNTIPEREYTQGKS